MFKFKEEKNQLLIKERNFSFEDMILCIKKRSVWRIYPHPRENYKHQILYDVMFRDYIYTVVIFQEKDIFHLITAFPNGKAKKEFDRWLKKQ